jgi:hypothetical protein
MSVARKAHQIGSELLTLETCQCGATLSGPSNSPPLALGLWGDALLAVMGRRRPLAHEPDLVGARGTLVRKLREVGL